MLDFGNKIIAIALFVISFSSVYSFPGDHESYTCIEYRRINCKDQNENPVQTDPINLDCIQHNSDYDFTAWGDSLTDLVDLEGFAAASYFEQPELLGVYDCHDTARSPFFLDSWGDYYTNFGGDPANPFCVQNRGIAGDTAQGLVNNILSNTCAAKDTAARSVLMIGGNDQWMLRLYSNALPFLAPQINGSIVKNISKLIDWNLENGKDVVLLGSIPTNPKDPYIYGYDSFIVNRHELCKGPTPPRIEPWWLILVPGVGEWLAAQLNHVVNAWLDFGNRLYHKDNTALGSAHMIATSIGQACLNDYLNDVLVPAYRSIYGDRVRIKPLYDSFSTGGSDIYAANFWVPNPQAWDKTLIAEDPAHIGPYGYKIWAQNSAPYLKDIGWNNPGAGQPAIDGNDTTPPEPPPPPDSGGCDLLCLCCLLRICCSW